MRALALGALIALSGCATQGIAVHPLPAQTPAADNATAIAQAQAAVRAAQAAHAVSATAAIPEFRAADAPSMRTYDPWQRFNRFNYRFNARFDRAIFLPAADAYRHLPMPIRAGVHNFFGNLAEVDSVINYTAQWRLRLGVRSLGRFVINTTLGIGGLFDLASRLHIAKAPTGFGTTLARWGVHPGPYLVIPILGPSTLREAVGLLADYGTSYGINVADLYRGDQGYALGIVNAVDERAHETFRYYSTGSPFEYDDIRFLYVHRLLLEDAVLHRKQPPRPPPPGVPAGE